MEFKGKNVKNHVTYIKYCSACVILTAMVLHVLGITPWNSILQMIGAAGWIYVGVKWRERALILNFLPQFAIIIPGLIYLYLK
jgi:Flp pilus assembly protein TadB